MRLIQQLIINKKEQKKCWINHNSNKFEIQDAKAENVQLILEKTLIMINVNQQLIINGS